MHLYRRLRSRFRAVKLKNRFLLVMILLTFLPVSLLGYISYRISGKTLEANHQRAITANLELASRNLEILLRPYVDISRGMMTHSALFDSLRLLEQRELKDVDYLGVRQLERSLQAALADPYVDTAFLFDNQFHCVFLSKSNSLSGRVQSLQPDERWKSTWVEAARQADGRELFYGRNVVTGDNGAETFSCVKLLKEPDSLRVAGMLVLSVKKELMDKALPASQPGEDREHYLILDPASGNETVFARDTDRQQTADILNQHETGSAYVVSRFRNAATGWLLINAVQRAQFARDSGTIGTATLTVAALMLGVVLVLYVLLAYAINRPLQKLEKVISEVAGGSREISVHFGEDEIGQIGNQFKAMVHNNLELHERVMEASLRQREAELSALQAQINPHFLYNTLDTMYWMAMKEHCRDIAGMAVSLSAIFKLSLNKGEKITTVDRETEHIRHYLHIQSMRFKNRFAVDMQVEEAMRPCRMLKLILQPLVENAIYHGIEPKQGNGNIRIRGWKENQCLVFTVEDDGVGMPEDFDVLSGFGVRNVSERIRLYGGDAGSLVFESRPGEGTRVRVVLPELQAQGAQG